MLHVQARTQSHFSERDVEMVQERVSADHRSNNLAKVKSKFEINTMEGKIKDVRDRVFTEGSRPGRESCQSAFKSSLVSASRF